MVWLRFEPRAVDESTSVWLLFDIPVPVDFDDVYSVTRLGDF